MIGQCGLATPFPRLAFVTYISVLPPPPVQVAHQVATLESQADLNSRLQGEAELYRQQAQAEVQAAMVGGGA